MSRFQLSMNSGIATVILKEGAYMQLSYHIPYSDSQGKVQVLAPTATPPIPQWTDIPNPGWANPMNPGMAVQFQAVFPDESGNPQNSTGCAVSPVSSFPPSMELTFTCDTIEPAPTVTTFVVLPAFLVAAPESSSDPGVARLTEVQHAE